MKQLIELNRKEKAILVTAKLMSEDSYWTLNDLAAELKELALSSGVEVVDEFKFNLPEVTADIYIGKGRAFEIAQKVVADKIDTVIFNNDLSGTQQRNLEELFSAKTIDRTQLILDIFAKHAKSPEGKTQVELAQLGYLLPRLSGKGIMLSRLGGGIGTSGPGETKLEVDRRRIKEKIIKLKETLKDLSTHRAMSRKKRIDTGLPLVSLVGYTSAGKSTLMNALTKSDQETKESLFTTLDPLSRQLTLSNQQKVIISDTVGFLHSLPHHLIEAFKATLEELVYSDILINVVDVSHARFSEHVRAVNEVLNYLGLEEKPIITVLNKIDKFSDLKALEEIKDRFESGILISAKNSINLDKLFSKIEDLLSDSYQSIELKIPIERMDLINYLYKNGRVVEIKYTQKHAKVVTYLSAKSKDFFKDFQC